MTIHILATARKEELLPYTVLVFRTLRVGFPTADVIVTGNDLPEWAIEEVMSACDAARCSFSNRPATIHHKWVEELLQSEQEPFVLCDTDLHLFSKVEDWKFDTALAGFRVPEFDDEFTGAITRSRLHTSLLFVDPKKVSECVAEHDSGFPDTPFNPLSNLVYPVCLPLNGRGFFHDTCSLLYHAIGGTAFTDQQKDAYCHFHFGCLEDIVLPRLTNGEKMKVARDEILKNPESGRGLWRHQEDYYRSRQPIFDGKDAITPVATEDTIEAAAWNRELCRGNVEAMAFCDGLYGLVHGTDDLIDTMRDGRPTMSKAQIISLFFAAACLYNCEFYRKNQSLLFPLMLDITNIYKTSVLWEVSPEKHKRQMADLMRMSTDRVYAMVALIVGGEAWMQEITQRLFDRDWILQHSAEGDPI